jgi:pimeloyl-ACP methyl ester carboxylesterase
MNAPKKGVVLIGGTLLAHTLARMRVRRSLMLLLLVTAACGHGSSGGATTTSAPGSSTTDGTTTTEAGPATTGNPPADPPLNTIAWKACGDFQCGTLRVPLDWANPGGTSITVALVKSPALVPSERIGALLVDPGGPGGSGVEFVKSGFTFSQAVQDRFDLIGWDPRGVGQSTPLNCGSTVPAFQEVDSGPDSPAEQADLDAKAKAVADECGAEDGPLIAHVGADDVARDMDAIRRALGEQTISYYGFSYGTLLGERYAELFPTGARAIVLDGVVDPAMDFVTFLRGQTVALEQTMAQVFAACDTDATCPVRGGTAAAYDRVAAAVEQQPLVTASGVLGPSGLATAAVFVTYDPSLWKDFYSALADADHGDGTAMYKLKAGYEDLAGFTIYAAVECVDSPHPEGAAAFAAFAQQLRDLSPRFGGPIANELLPCAFWPAPSTRVPGDVHGVGAPPELVIGNTGDAATPYSQAEKVAGTLQGAALLTYVGQGHTSYGMSTCVDDIVTSYLVSLQLPAPGTTCH